MSIMREVLLSAAVATCVLQLSIAAADTSASFTSPSRVDKMDSHWRLDAHSNCWVYIPWSHDNSAVVEWSGSCENQKAVGFGTATSTIPDGNKRTVSGTFAAGQLEGHGTFDDSIGIHIEGEFRGGVLTGHGVLSSPHGLHYEGEFVSGTFEGPGKVSWPNGDTYAGEFHAGLEGGTGVYTFVDGHTIQGNFSGGEITGHAVLTQKTGKRLEGEIIPPQPNSAHPLTRPAFPDVTVLLCCRIGMEVRFDVGPDGISRNPKLRSPTAYPGVDSALYDAIKQWHMRAGTLSGIPIELPIVRTYVIESFKNGTRYEGALVSGVIEGDGVTTTPNGLRYEGHFAGGHYDGEGKVVWPDGDSYVGTFRAGSLSGHGVYNCKDGRVFSGNFLGGRVWGHAILRKPDGSVVEGEFAPPRPDPANPTPEPKYPPVARRYNMEGQVVVRFLVKTDGTVGNTRVVLSSGISALDQAALDAMIPSKMLPGTLNGSPIDIEDIRVFNFQIR
jgi:TonB family protein